MFNVKTLDSSRIAQDLQIRKVQVESVVQLLDEGNTVPFITRYRKERTGGLNEEVIRQIQLRIKTQRQLADRKLTILKSIEHQGKLTEELRQNILGADTTKRLEDLYLPHKPKKRSLATIAKEKGLEPLAIAIWNRDPAVNNLSEFLASMVNPEKGLASVEDIKTGVQHILAEMISETADVRAAARFTMWETGQLQSNKSEKLPPNKGSIFKDYFKFSESVRKIPPHRILALNRGEREGALKLKLDWNKDLLRDRALKSLAEFCLHQAQTGQLPRPTFVPNQNSSPASAAPTEQPLASGENQTSPETPPPDAAVSSESPAPPSGEVLSPEASSPPASPPENNPEQQANTSPQTDNPEFHTSAEPAPTPAPESPSPVEGAPTPGSPELASLPPVAGPNEGEQLSPESEYRSPHAEFLRQAADDALNRLITTSIEREIRRELMDEAEGHAITVFAHNLRNLLLQRPLHHRRVLAIDPGFRSGCKLAVLDEYGNLLDHGTVYPHPLKPKVKPGGDKEHPSAGQATTPPESKPGESEVGKEPTSSEPVPTEQSGQSTATEETPSQETTPPGATEHHHIPVDVALAATGETGPEPTEGASSSESPTPPATAEASTQAPPTSSETKPTVDQRAEAKAVIEKMVAEHRLDVVAIGNGTACRETEEFIAELINEKMPQLSYVIVNEAGASVYSASNIGREEFPDYDATLRGTISIGRRLEDPLAELVKIDPPHLGVGLYQHDVNPKQLKESLEAVVESCVNQVGVDVNTASVPLLKYVAGLNQLVAREIVDYRKANGPFKTRDQFLQVPGMGQARFVQAAGFLKIYEGDNPLDKTWIHPESYGITTQLIGQLGYGPDVIQDPHRSEEFHAKLKALAPSDLAAQLNAGEPTLRDILDSLHRPGRDPREDLPLPVFRKGILKIEDLHEGMELRGTVLNVVDFGAFVDVGLKDCGLVHISQLANRYVKNPFDVVAVGDVVTVWVLKVDLERRHVSLTMIKPGTEKKPGRPEQRGRPERARPTGEAGAAAPEGEQRPPRGRRPGGPPPRDESKSRPPRSGPPQQQRAGGPGRGQRPHSQGPAPHPREQSAEGTGGRETPRSDRPPLQMRPPRKPRPDLPKPKLSKAALEGKEALKTFRELSAFFAAKREPEPGAEKQIAPQQPPQEVSPPSGTDGVTSSEKESPPQNQEQVGLAPTTTLEQPVPDTPPPSEEKSTPEGQPGQQEGSTSN